MSSSTLCNKCAVQTERINFYVWYKQGCKRDSDISHAQHVESDSQYNFGSQAKDYHSMKGHNPYD